MQNKKFLRSERVADLLHKELAVIIVKFCQDPRLDKLTITNVKLSHDLSIAKIYFTNFSNITDPGANNKNSNSLASENVKQVLKILKNASNFLRAQLAIKMSLRKIPELKFFYDENTDHAVKIEHLLSKIERMQVKDKDQTHE